MRLWRFLQALALAFVLVATAVQAASNDTAALRPDLRADLTVEINGLETVAGQVRIAVFDSQEVWLEEASHASILDVEESTLTWTIEGIPVGDYGIAIYHDVNANSRNDRNFLGIPSEPYGFSNNQRVRFGPPKWNKAKFAVSAPETTIRIRVK